MKEPLIPEEFVESEILPTDRALIVPTGRRAYAAARNLMQETGFLQTPAAEISAFGHLVAYAMDFAFEGLIKSGRWNFDFSWRAFQRPTGKHLCIFTKNAVLTISQLIEADKQPRRAEFRENYKFANQAFLFPELEPEFDPSDKPHMILGHGYHTMRFAHLGIPSPEHRETWLYQSKNLVNMIHDATDDVAPVEEAVDEQLTLKEQIKRHVRDNG
jgi:hypothetical protein